MGAVALQEDPTLQEMQQQLMQQQQPQQAVPAVPGARVPMTYEGFSAHSLDKMVDTFLLPFINHANNKAIINYNGTNLAYNHACDTANKLKLSKEQKKGILPFPDSRTTNINVTQAGNEDVPLAELTDQTQGETQQAQAAAPNLQAAISPKPESAAPAAPAQPAEKPSLLGRLTKSVLPWALAAGGLGTAAGVLATKGQMPDISITNPTSVIQPADDGEVDPSELGIQVIDRVLDGDM